VTTNVSVFAFPQITAGEDAHLANGDFAAIRSSPSPSGHESYTSAIVRRNLFLIRNASATLFFRSTNVAFANFTFDDNLYWSYAVKPSLLWFPTWHESDETFVAWQRLGQDIHSKIADPLLTHPQAYNFFQFNSSSPVHSIGFIPINISTVGPLF